ncbi:MAG: hypothetical protein LBO69_01290 [Ignavibacteria bacterium]|jgi:hypothetical protein|nr:hypothetical protein [Ignavibacteria bacterium]
MQTTNPKKNNSEFEARLEAGLKYSFERLIEFKKKNNSPLVVSRNGKIEKIYL